MDTNWTRRYLGRRRAHPVRWLVADTLGAAIAATLLWIALGETAALVFAAIWLLAATTSPGVRAAVKRDTTE
jgi:hypothetical protein